MTSSLVRKDLQEFESEPSLRVQNWAAFLTSYAEGDWQPDSTPAKPTNDSRETTHRPSVDGRQDAEDLSAEPDLYTSPIIDRNIANKVRQYCTVRDFLPPPRSPDEALREEIILEYDLLSPVQSGNIQSAIDIISAFFPGTVVTFTLFRNAIQTFVAVAGPDDLLKTFGLVNGMYVEPNTGLCGHSILLDNEIMFVPSLSDDWRFRSNPYVMAGLKSYIGSAVSLELDPLNVNPHRKGRPERVGIGALNVLFMYTPLIDLTPQQSMVVRNITKMLESQLRATWEGHIRTREAKVRRAITDLIEEGFVGNQYETVQPSAELGGPHGVISGGGALTMFEDLAHSALSKLLTLNSEMEAMCMIDVRSLRIQSKPNAKVQYHVDPSSPHPISAIAVAHKDGMVWDLPPKSSALLSYLNQSHSLFTFTQTSLSGLESELPSSTRSHLVMPFFTLDQPSFIILAASRAETVQQASVNITRSVGSVLLAKAIQARVMEADSGKATFLSSISHELRTPMHSIMSGLHLAQSSLQAEDWASIPSLLNVVETSGHALHRILDDVLDFDPAYNGKSKVSRIVTVDLLRLAQDAIQICMARSDDLESSSTVHLEHQERNWIAKVDEARYHRVIINGLTNAMKFCKDGSISVSLSTIENSTKLVTRITDTGIGIDDKVLPRLLEPFTKQDLHSPGTGLGLYITKNLINSMGGTFAIRSSLGKGTVFEAILPIQLESPRDLSDATASYKRILQYKGDPLDAQPFVLPPAPASTPSTPLIQSPRKPTGTVKAKQTDPNALKVMVVDDNRICRLLLLRSLQTGPTAVQCQQAADGNQAVETFKTFQPDLVITDISMPGMDGITASQKMRTISEEMKLPPCKIYALTGLGSSDPRLKSIGMGGSAALDGWLVKGQDDLKEIHTIVATVYQEIKQRKESGPVEMFEKINIAENEKDILVNRTDLELQV
ncbi:hypothetical protein I302_105524 [Kwoniella bestiolae CBS 10118]|uniref:histidine kinase n=1 Tax=Kwoniella bestiolae CBS 10118 TaxID=1296100 RepID=A0A1B9FTC4_9TREE|nr:hypothetical protein I302_08806 [Kwoniella bestiolae CBS 10118]OCF22025.1 hypothetical protein I302_08806 [Kwoniella bestiolae CBS 10118]